MADTRKPLKAKESKSKESKSKEEHKSKKSHSKPEVAKTSESEKQLGEATKIFSLSGKQEYITARSDLICPAKFINEQGAIVAGIVEKVKGCCPFEQCDKFLKDNINADAVTEKTKNGFTSIKDKLFTAIDREKLFSEVDRAKVFLSKIKELESLRNGEEGVQVLHAEIESLSSSRGKQVLFAANALVIRKIDSDILTLKTLVVNLSSILQFADNLEKFLKKPTVPTPSVTTAGGPLHSSVTQQPQQKPEPATVTTGPTKQGGKK